MAIIISSILTVFIAGLSTGGLLVSRRIDPHQTVFLVVGLAFFLFSYIGMFLGSKSSGFISHGAFSIFFGLFCFGLIGFLVWKYDPSFGFVKQEPATLSIFVAFFLLLGFELGVLELSLWFTLFGFLFFVGGLIVGFMFIYQIIQRHRSPQFFALIPLIPLLFIGLFKLI
ncbi:hypothetical protein DS745_14660 [Anaerobacillus alkaliphilus]|uniref:Uncharacterized protein n=1 Tax=Anaerobacillus alkaliphilus TaxID=1548597 RepID=A0A4Q0VSC3_9BACI|nr:hypothetical protein [Anaerobacillus alkaliphilus]RXI99461.1 hypothetical protein DS745_14660 [Anaerobacillus alkaliphilus]